MPLSSLEEPKVRRSRRPRIKPLVAGAATIALSASGIFLVATPASAAPGTAEASARYLSGSLLERSLDDLAALSGERAVANGDSDAVVTESGALDLSVLGGTVELQSDGGVPIPLTIADAGVISQYAQASQAGSSRAAAGAVTDQGAIDLDPTASAPESLTFDLSNLLGDDITSSVANATLTTGVNTATANLEAGGAAQGDYNIAGLQANLTSPVVADLSNSILASVTDLEGTVDENLGDGGSLSTGLTATLGTLGVVDVAVNADVDLAPTVQNVIEENNILGADGPVQVNLSTGVISVDIAAVLEANGRDLNDLAPGEQIINSELVDFITADVDELVNGLLSEVQDAVTTALQSTDLTVSATVGDEASPVLTLNADGTLNEISTGAAPVAITVLDNDFDVAPLNGLIATAVNNVLALQLNTNALDADLTPLYPAIDTVLTNLVTLEGNVQEDVDGTFTETALRLNVLDSPAVPTVNEVLSLNLAQAAVGPNAAPTEDPVAAPTITAIDPIFGPEAGGTEVTVTGTNLADVTSVTFDGNEATNLTVVSPTELTVVAPAGTGLVDVAVTSPGGTATLQDAYTYIPAADGGNPAIVSFTPTSGPEAGGTEVTIIGTNLDGADGVLFGDAPASDFTVVSENEITAVTPAGTGAVPVTVTVAGDNIVAPGDFTYIPANGTDAVVVTTVNPTAGPEAGGTEVTIGGSGLDGVTGVSFDGNAGTDLVVNSDTELTVNTPAGTGEVPIILTADGSNTTAPNTFTYIPAGTPPTITGVNPNQGPTAGGTTVTIGGTNFDGDDTTVSFDGVPATDTTVVSPTEITATTPAGTAGAVDVTVTTGSGQEATLPDGYTYIADSNDGGTPGTGNGDDYPNCTAAAADGKANFASTDRNLDRDGDGIACDNNGAGGGNGTNGSNDNGATDRNLAYTGSELTGGIATALLMLLAGGGVFLLRRKFSI